MEDSTTTSENKGNTYAIERNRPILQDFTWANVNFVAGKSTVLSTCWGEVKSGEVCAIMGPSGAGKSSLLNVLAGRSTSNNSVSINGNICVNGKQIDPATFRRNIAYVMQDDALMPTATPREALRFSARLRLPSSITEEQINQRVERLLTDLGLMVCADVIIGGALIKGISGGQRKRTSVGVEIITDPQLLFLDEPTSGLDSYSAFTLVKLLKQISYEKAILCTIHQPASDVYYLFDKVIFMKAGRIFYFGSPSEVTPYYANLKYVCPDNYSPSDYIMDLVQKQTVEELEANNLFLPIPDKFASDAVITSSRKVEKNLFHFKNESSGWAQATEVAFREIVNCYRDTGMLGARFGVTLFMGILHGLVFLNGAEGNSGDYNKFNSHVGAVSQVMIMSMKLSGQSILLSFPFERPMFLREYVTGTYGLMPYYLCKILVEVPITFIQMIVLNLITFYMMGFQGRFIYWVIITFGCAMVSNSLCLALGCVIPDVKTVTEFAPLTFVPQFLFAGFFIRTSMIPDFLRWAQYLCSIKYGMNLALLTEFSPWVGSCSDSTDASINCSTVLSSNNIDPDLTWFYAFMFFVLFIFARLLGALFLTQAIKSFY